MSRPKINMDIKHSRATFEPGSMRLRSQCFLSSQFPPAWDIQTGGTIKNKYLLYALGPAQSMAP